MKGSPDLRHDAPKTAVIGNVRVRIYHVRRKADGREFWQVADYSSGKRRLISFADQDAAQREAVRIAQALASGKVAALELGPQERAAYGRAMELLRPTGIPLEVAAATFAQAMALLDRQPARLLEAARHFARRSAIHPTLVQDAVRDFIAHKVSRGAAARSVADLRTRLARFAQAFQGALNEISAPQLQQWLDRMDLSPQSILNYRRVLSNLFNHGVARGWLHREDNPVLDLERISVRRRGAVTLFQPDEAERILAHSQPPIRACLALGFFAGLRSKEIQRLDWRDIDLHRGFVAIGREQAKTASRRLVPIVPNLARWLALDRVATGSLWPQREWSFHAAQTNAARRAGLAWRGNAARHSFCSYRLAQTRNAAQVALEAGNSQTMIHRHYAELVRPDEAEQWFSIFPPPPGPV